MLREKHKQRNCEADRIEALCRDGQARSSDEAALYMRTERRGWSFSYRQPAKLPRQKEPLKVAKPFRDSQATGKWQAYLEVKSKEGAPGVDGESLEAFERKLKKNLYRIWNRFVRELPPPAVGPFRSRRNRAERVLGVPTVSDRIAQTVVKMVLEPILEPVFDETPSVIDLAGRPMTRLPSTRKRCWAVCWVVEF